MSQTNSITIRVRKKDWVELRRRFPGIRNESVSDYIERIAKEVNKNENNKQMS